MKKHIVLKAPPKEINHMMYPEDTMKLVCDMSEESVEDIKSNMKKREYTLTDIVEFTLIDQLEEYRDTMRDLPGLEENTKQIKIEIDKKIAELKEENETKPHKNI